jgi:hypothetical protein
MLVFGIVQLTRGCSGIRGSSPDYKAIAAEALSDMKEFKSADGDFKIKYPSAWGTPPEEGFQFHTATLKGLINASVSVGAIPPGLTLDALYDAGLQEIKELDPNPKALERQNITVHGVPAIRSRTSFVAKGVTGRNEMLMVISEGKRYVFICTTAEERLAEFGPICDAMLQSFELTR